MLPQQYCLRWRYHHSNLQTMFSQLLEKESFCDVTLACEGKTIKAHKIVLSACSTYFETILSQYEEKDPILIMRDVKFVDIKCLVEFMYKGEINVEHCHLATLLKTAEELRIKGLAEVSWKDEEAPPTSKETSDSNGIQQAALPQVATVMEDNPEMPSVRKRRGRPPLDDYETGYSTPPKMSHIDDGYSNDAMSTSEHDGSIWEGEQVTETSMPVIEEPRIKVKKELQQPQESNDSFLDMQTNANDSRQEIKQEMSQKKCNSNSNVTTSSGQSFLTPALEKEWSDVVKMNDYLSTRRRQQFWEEPFTKRVMDAIKTKNLEMKVAAELLGVSYGTLYGRYRDSYGCLKHPYRVRDFWTEPAPSEIIHKLKKKELTLFRAAEQLNVTPQTLSNFLITSAQSEGIQHMGFQMMTEGEELEMDEDEADSILPDLPNNAFQQLVNYSATNNSSSSNNSVLANCPDITIVKKEKPEDGKMNNNSDHSESNDQIK
ncbi:transcriptional regulator Kaiso-like [Coccinella septempunctata]|uniref:transcriptional regulator Kaiso-like n=1 Tax=Coccinella septempunctata TaxID=41139 RepID=UPI001D08B34D|nr:transcriptional regulator Kaiso-like [Coccinella septempunctata]